MKHKILLYIILTTAVIAGFILYNPFLLYFQNDDFVHIPLYAKGQFLQHNSFRPVCDLFMMMDYKLWGKNAYGYHITNLLLHIINSLLVYRLAFIICLKYNIDKRLRQFGLIAAVLFFVYANHSEAVFWILGRSAIIGCLFFLPACIFYLQREKKYYFFLSMLFACIAWCSYENTWVLPAVFVVISFIEIKKYPVILKTEAVKLFTAFFLFAIYLAARKLTINEIAGSYEATHFLQFDAGILLENFIKMFVRCWLPPSGEKLFLILSIALLLLIFCALAIIKDTKKIYTCSALLFLTAISILPCISLGTSTNGSEGERFLYLPTVFCCLLFAYIYSSFMKTKKGGASFLLVIFSVHLYFLFISGGNYQTAGNVVKSFTTAISLLTDSSNIVIDNLPQEQHGALIFRDGVQEAVEWLYKNKSYNIIVCSKDSSNSLLFIKGYQTSKMLFKELFSSSHCFPENKNNCRYFRFTGSALLISQ